MEMDKKRTRKKADGGEPVADTGDQAKVRSFRLTDETVDGINNFKHAMGAPTLEDALKTMLHSFSMTDAKASLPERASEIGEFEVLCRRLIDAYTHSLLLYHDAETRAREAVKEELDRKNQVISRMSYMQTQTDNHVQKLKDEAGKLKAELRQVTAERDALATELATIKKAEHTDADLSARFDALQKVLEAVVAGKAR